MRVLVTGTSRGIGAAVRARLRSRGDEVVGVSRGGSAQDLAVDLATDFDAGWVLDQACERLGSIDGLVHCAGFAHHASLAHVSSAALDAHYRVHARSAILLTRELSARLGGREGAVVFVTSTLAQRGVAGTSAYAAAKGALEAAARALAVELAPRVRVNCIAPGGVDTAMVAERAEELAALHPLGRLATPDEIADGVLFALDARFMTGSILTLDGGLSARG
jgi:3-oxoacyl-[acyl-carrier protein] reductase